MKRFLFKLQKLLDIRSHKEKRIKNELAKAQFERNTIFLKREGLSRELESGHSKMAEDLKNSILSGETMQMYQRYFHRLKEQISHKDAQIRSADGRIALINERLVEARKERRILERLKENKWKEHQYGVQKEEQEFFDEVGTTTFLRKSREREFKEKSRIPMNENKQVKKEEHFMNREVSA